MVVLQRRRQVKASKASVDLTLKRVRCVAVDDSLNRLALLRQSKRVIRAALTP